MQRSFKCTAQLVYHALTSLVVSEMLFCSKQLRMLRGTLALCVTAKHHHQCMCTPRGKDRFKEAQGHTERENCFKW